MNFLYPPFLWALLAIAIPIIIHLFNFKKFKKVYFSDISLLKLVELETSKKSNLKHLLILLSRILAILALVLAFAQPFWKADYTDLTAGEKLVSVYIDNSFSMQNKLNEFTLLDNAKKEAEKIADLYQQNDKFQLITNDFEPKHQHFLTREEFLSELEKLTISSNSRLLSQVEQKQLDFLKKETSTNKIGYYVSDFQKSTSDLEELKFDSIINLNLVSVTPNQLRNVYVDSVWFESPVRMVNKQEKLFAKIYNTTQDAIQLKVELTINGGVKGIINQDILANSSEIVSLDYKLTKPGIVTAKLVVSEYPDPTATFDDSYYFSYVLKETSNVLVINQFSMYLDNISGNINQLFKSDPYLKLTNLSSSSINYSKFSESDLVIINQLNSYSSGLISELLKYTESGGSIFIIPGENMELNSANELLLAAGMGRFVKKDTTNTKVIDLNLESPFFRDVFEKTPKNIDLPKVFSMYQLNSSIRNSKTTLMKTQTSNDFLALSTYEKGKVFVLGVPLSSTFSNFASHSLFVTTLLRIAESSGASQQTSTGMETNSIRIKDNGIDAANFKIVNKELGVEFIPESEVGRGEIELYFSEEISTSGNYEVIASDKLIYSFGVNYSRKESNFRAYSAEDLTKSFSKNNVKVIDVFSANSANETAESYQDSTKLWKWFILLALLFLVIEIALVKILK
jgi:hypothetical protein